MTSSPAAPDRPEPPLRKRCFDPVVDQGTGILILGSLPGEKSLASQEYYGNPQNQFWRLMSHILCVELVPLDYPARLDCLRENGIGLWDVVAEAHRNGSLDSFIRDRDDNDLQGLLAQYPNITTVAFNGGTAAKLGLRVLGEQASACRIVQLPSSSPAYTLAYAEKLARWHSLYGELHSLKLEGNEGR